MSKKIKVFKIEVQNSEECGELMVEYQEEVVEAVKDLIEELDRDDGFEIKISSLYMTEKEISESQAIQS